MPLFVDLITLPNASTTLNNAAAWSGPLFDALVVIAVVGVGIIIGGIVVSFLMGKIVGGVKTALNRKKGGRRRRR